METFSRGNIRNQVIPIFALLETAKGHLGARNILFGIFEVFKLRSFSTDPATLIVLFRTSVSSFHTTPLALFASVYEKPGT